MNARDPRQANAINRQLALERQAQEQRQAAHEALLASMPDDLRQTYGNGLFFEQVWNLLKRGMFPNDTHQLVHDCVDGMKAACMDVDFAIQAHPRFAEFFPEQAAKLEARKLQADIASAPAPTILGPDGAPLELEPAPGILHLEDVLQ